jgi:tRNA pseudouridine13 synthase
MMLKSLARNPEDFSGAFRRLPSRLLELFVQAYQSYLFNRFLSGRIKHGFSLNAAEVGDYVIGVEKSGVSMPAMHRIASSETVKEVNRAVHGGRMRLAIPLIGFKQSRSLGVQGEIESRVLEEEEVSPCDFRVSAMAGMSSRGELRAALTPLMGFSSDDVLVDAEGVRRHTLRMDFMLYRGSYATIVLREFMKPPDPVKAGF